MSTIEVENTVSTVSVVENANTVSLTDNTFTLVPSGSIGMLSGNGIPDWLTESIRLQVESGTSSVTDVMLDLGNALRNLDLGVTQSIETLRQDGIEARDAIVTTTNTRMDTSVAAVQTIAESRTTPIQASALASQILISEFNGVADSSAVIATIRNTIVNDRQASAEETDVLAANLQTLNGAQSGTAEATQVLYTKIGIEPNGDLNNSAGYLRDLKVDIDGISGRLLTEEGIVSGMFHVWDGAETLKIGMTATVSRVTYQYFGGAWEDANGVIYTPDDSLPLETVTLSLGWRRLDQGASDEAEAGRLDAILQARAHAIAEASTARGQAEATAATELGLAVNTISGVTSGLQDQIDNTIASWFEDYLPTTSNEPASSWTTAELKTKHEGDLFYNTSSGAAYRYIKTAGEYSWTVIADEAITTALADAARAQDTADGKRMIFGGNKYPQDVVNPVLPNGGTYIVSIGDMWIPEGTGVDGGKITGEVYRFTGGSKINWAVSTKYAQDLTDTIAAIDVTFESVTSDISDITSDLKVTDEEKVTLRNVRDLLVTDHSSLSELQVLFSLGSDELDIYVTAKTSYSDYLVTTFKIDEVGTSTVTTANRTELTVRNQNYIYAKATFLKVLSDSTRVKANKGITDAEVARLLAISEAAEAYTAASNDLSGAITTLNGTIDGVDDLVQEITADTKVTPNEKVDLRKVLITVGTDDSALLATHTKYSGHSKYSGQVGTTYTTYEDKSSKFKNDIITLFLDGTDSVTTTITAATRTLFNTGMSEYLEARNVYTEAITAFVKKLADDANALAISEAADAKSDAIVASAGSLSDALVIVNTDIAAAASLAIDITSDLKLTPDEKRNLRNLIQTVTDEKAAIDLVYTTSGIAAAELSSEHANYVSTYTALTDKLDPLVVNPTITSNITGATRDAVTTALTNYTTSREVFRLKVTKVLESTASQASAWAAGASKLVFSDLDGDGNPTVNSSIVGWEFAGSGTGSTSTTAFTIHADNFQLRGSGVNAVKPFEVTVVDGVPSTVFKGKVAFNNVEGHLDSKNLDAVTVASDYSGTIVSSTGLVVYQDGQPRVTIGLLI